MSRAVTISKLAYVQITPDKCHPGPETGDFRGVWLRDSMSSGEFFLSELQFP